jgi:hypothetical protein
MYALGIRGKTLELLKSYLEFRRMHVKIQTTVSGQYNVNLGVPQGSVLGPLIFLMYINDLPNYLNAECTVIFADDVNICVSADSMSELQYTLTTHINKFNSWCTRNHLILNIEKTVCIKFSNPEITPNLKINSIAIKNVTATKFLGIYIDQKLCWSEHINYVCNKLNSSYYALLQLKYLLDTNSILNVYYCMVVSVISYNIIFWGQATDSDRVLIHQKRIIRLLFNIKPHDSCKPTFKKHKLLTLFTFINV